MKSLNSLMQEIIQLTSAIETNYPELYKYLSETPLNFSDPDINTVSKESLEDYLESLKIRLQHHIATRKQ